MQFAQLKQHSIPFFVPSIGEQEIEEVVSTLRSGWLTTGAKVKQFEQVFAERVDADCAIAVSSCTAALQLALEAVGIKPGDEVLVPTLTFAATAEVVCQLGAVPVLVDCRADTLTIDADQIEEKITGRTKAIIPMHYAGHPCDMDRILEIARKHGLFVIEDAAHALPARFGDQLVGSIADISCFSFYANKTITTGEGGMVTTNHADLAERMRIMSLHGISKDAWKRFSASGSWDYEIIAPGYKSNMTDIAASLGVHQMAKCDAFWRRRVDIARMYSETFEEIDEIVTPTVEVNIQHAWHLYVIQLKLNSLRIPRNAFIQQLASAGIGTSVHYRPLHMQPFYRQAYGYQDNDFPVARAAFERMISLPIYPKMTNGDVRYVVDTVNQIVATHACFRGAELPVNNFTEMSSYVNE